MKYYADKGAPGFKGCEATVEFIKKINDLADAMNSRLPREALNPNPESKHYKVFKILTKKFIISFILCLNGNSPDFL